MPVSLAPAATSTAGIGDRADHHLGNQMTERFDVAANRHHRVGDRLAADGETDDAAYHYGLVGENALKHGLSSSGVAAALDAAKVKRKVSPMWKHFPKLTSAIETFSGYVPLYALGRIGAQMQAVVGDPAFATRFQGWSIDIRYADDQCTPVAPNDCERWARDADDLLRTLVLMV
jgi:hypothetical protein